MAPCSAGTMGRRCGTRDSTTRRPSLRPRRWEIAPGGVAPPGVRPVSRTPRSTDEGASSNSPSTATAIRVSMVARPPGLLTAAEGTSHAWVTLFSGRGMDDRATSAEQAGAHRRAVQPIHPTCRGVRPVRLLGCEVRDHAQRQPPRIRRRNAQAVIPDGISRPPAAVVDARIQRSSPYTKRLFVHRFRVVALEELDDEFGAWLCEAYAVGQGAHLNATSNCECKEFREWWDSRTQPAS